MKLFILRFEFNLSLTSTNPRKEEEMGFHKLLWIVIILTLVFSVFAQHDPHVVMGSLNSAGGGNPDPDCIILRPG